MWGEEVWFAGRIKKHRQLETCFYIVLILTKVNCVTFMVLSSTALCDETSNLIKFFRTKAWTQFLTSWTSWLLFHSAQHFIWQYCSFNCGSALPGHARAFNRKQRSLQFVYVWKQLLAFFMQSRWKGLGVSIIKLSQKFLNRNSPCLQHIFLPILSLFWGALKVSRLQKILIVNLSSISVCPTTKLQSKLSRRKVVVASNNTHSINYAVLMFRR